jgi:hypothetical protein
VAIECREFVATWLPQGMYLGLEQGSVPPGVFDAQAVPGAHLLHVAPESVNSAAVRDMLLAQPPGVVAQMVDGSARSVAVGLDEAGAFARADALGVPVLHPGNTLAGVNNERILAIDAQERPARTPADAKFVLVLPELHLLTEKSATRHELDASLSQVLIGPPMLSQVRLIDADEAELGIPPLVLDTFIDRVGGIAGVEELATSAAEASFVQGGVMGLWRALAALELGEARLVTVDAPGNDTATTVLALRFPGGVGLLHDTPSGVRAATLPRRPTVLSIAHVDVSEKATDLINGSALVYPWLRSVNPEREAAPTADAFTLNCVLTAIAVDMSLIDGHGHQAGGVDTATGPKDRGLPETDLANYQAQTIGLPGGESRVYSCESLEAVRDVMAAAPRGARGLVLVHGEDARISHAFNVVHDAYGVTFLDGQRGGLARPPQVITDVAFLPLTDNIKVPNEHPLTVLSPDRRSGAIGFEAETVYRTSAPVRLVKDEGVQEIATSPNLDIHLESSGSTTIIELVSKPYNVLDGETRHRRRDEVWRDFTRTLQRMADVKGHPRLKTLFSESNGFQAVDSDVLDVYNLNGTQSFIDSSNDPLSNTYMQYTVGVPLAGAYQLLKFGEQHTWDISRKALVRAALDFADQVSARYRAAAMSAANATGRMHVSASSLARDVMELRGLLALAYTHVIAPVIDLSEQHAGSRSMLVKNQLVAASRTSLTAIRDLLSERAQDWVQANAPHLRDELNAHALSAFPQIRVYLGQTGGGSLLRRRAPGADGTYSLGALIDNVLLPPSPHNRELTQDRVLGIRTHVSAADLARAGDRLILMELRAHGHSANSGLADIDQNLSHLEAHVLHVARSTAAAQTAINGDQHITGSFPFKWRSSDLTDAHRAEVEKVARQIVQRIVATGSAAEVLVEGGGKNSGSDAGAQRAKAVAEALAVSVREHLDGVGLARSLITVQHRSRGDGVSRSPHSAQWAVAAKSQRTVVLWLAPPVQQTGQMLASDIRNARFGSAGADVDAETREVPSDYTDESLRAAYPWLGKINPGHAAGGEYATNCVMAALSLDLSLRDGTLVFEAATTEPLNGGDLLNYQRQALDLADDEQRVYGIPTIEAAVETLRAAALGSRALITVHRSEDQVNHVFVGIRDERGVAVVDPQTGRLGRLPLDTTGLTLIPLSDDIAEWMPAPQAVDVLPVTVPVRLDPARGGAHLDSATRELLVTLPAQAVGRQLFGAGQAIRGPQQAHLAGGSSRAPQWLADLRARPNPMRGHVLGLAAADGSVSFREVADARPDVRTLFLRFTDSGVDVGPIDEMTRNERWLGFLPGGHSRSRRPVRIIINTPHGQAGEAVLDQLRRAFRDTGREAFVPAPGTRVALYQGDLAVVNSQREPGQWVSVGAERPTEPRHYTTDPMGRLGRPMTNPAVLPTEDELVWWMVRDSTLPASLEPPAGESIRSFGLELEFALEPGMPEQEVAVRRGRMVNDLRALGLTKESLVRNAHSALKAGYNSRRSGWTLEIDFSVSGEVVSPILPYQRASDEERSRVWRDVALVLAVIRRHGGRSSTKVGGHVHLGVGDFQRNVDVMQRLIDVFRGHQDILYRLATLPGQRLHRGAFYAAPLAPPVQSAERRSWPYFDLRRNGGITDRDIALNTTPLLDDHARNHPAKDDHIEVRIFDGDLSLGGVQLRTELSRALADKVTEPSGRVPQYSTLGEHFIRWDPANREDAAALERILDLLPAEATAARVRVRELWRLTAWQMPIQMRAIYRGGLFFPGQIPDQSEWQLLSPIAERNMRQPTIVYQPMTEEFQPANPVALSDLLKQWLPSDTRATPAIAHGVVIALARTRVDYFGMLPRTLGVSVVQPQGTRWSVQAIPGGGGWLSASGWELLTRNADGFPITRPLGREFGPQALESVLGDLRTIGPVPSAPVAGTTTGRRLGLLLGSEQPQLSQGDLAGAPRADSVEDGSWLGDDAQPVMWEPLPGARGGWALLPGHELAQVGDLELPGEGASVPVVVHPAANGTVRVPVRDLDGVGRDVAASTPMDGGSMREVRLTAEQLAPSLDRRLPPGAPVALLSCRAGELPDGFARQLATALGRDVVAPTRDLVVEPPGGRTRLFTVEGESWVLFTPDFGDWDVMNDEIEGFVDDDGVAHLGERAVYPFDGIAAVTLPPSWSVRLSDGVTEQHPNVYVIGESAAPALRKLIMELAQVANVDHPVVVLGAPHPGKPALASDVAGLNYLLEQLAQRDRLPVVVARAKIDSELLTVVQQYGATILHPTTQRPDNAGLGLDMYWKATASRRDERTAASVHLWPGITAEVLRTAVTLSRPTSAVARVEDTLGELIWAADLTTARHVFDTARQRWSPAQMRDNLVRVEQMIERVPDQPDLSRYAPVLEFGATGHADIVFDYALADPADKPATLLTAVGNLDTVGLLDADLDGGLSTGRLAAMVTAVGTTDLSASVLTVIGEIKAGQFANANTFIERNRGRITSEQKRQWVDAIAGLREFPTMQNNDERKIGDQLEQLSASVFSC